MAEDDNESMQVLRTLIAEARAPTGNNPKGVSRPEFLRMIGVPDSRQFESHVRSLARFEEGAGGLAPYLRAKLLQHFRRKLPHMDILDFSLYATEATECGNLHLQLKAFHKIPDGRVDEVAPQASGRFFWYKKPVNPNRKNRILRSYAKIQRPTPSASFLMAIEYQKAVFESVDIGHQVDHDFFMGICTKKDGVLVLPMRQLHHGAIKTIYVDAMAVDTDNGLINRGFGVAMETCD